MSRRLRVILADDHAVVRAGLAALINAEPDMEVVGEAADGRQAVAMARELRPDVVVMDLTMPVMSGLEATRQIAREDGAPGILVLTMHDDPHYLYSVLEAGGSGYVLKSSADTDLMTGIRTVAAGGAFLTPSATRHLLRDYVEGQRETGGHDRLSDRETEVLQLTAAGYTSQDIARKLHLSPKTVDTYRQRVMEKLDLHHRADLVRYALRRGLLTP